MSLPATSEHAAPGKPVALTPSTDRLTIGRIMLITAGIAVGLAAFIPEPGHIFDDAQNVRYFLNSILLGAALPGLIFILTRRRGGHRIGVGGWIALTASLGVLILLPPSAGASRFHAGEGTGLLCLHYTLPLAMFFMLLAALVAGQLRWRHLSRQAPWSERYGFYLAIAWLPISLWLLSDIYREWLF